MTFGRILFATVFIVAGLLHFFFTATYLKVMPAYLPAPRLLVYVSGICEMLGGIGLLLPATRQVAAWGLMALLIAVMPANVQMAMDQATKWQGIPQWLLWARLPMQLPLIWWSWTLRQGAP